LKNLDLPQTITIGEVKDVVDHIHNNPVNAQVGKKII
jgi:hypothetical protein